MRDLDQDERMVALQSLDKESRLARDERRAGVVIEEVYCPLLVVAGTKDEQWSRARYEGLRLPAASMDSKGASHWGLVLNRRVLARLVPEVHSWVKAKVTTP